MSQETGEGQFMDLIEQVMGSDRLLSSTDVCKMVDSISKDDVVAVSSLYSKTFLKWPLENRQNRDLNDKIVA